MKTIHLIILTLIFTLSGTNGNAQVNLGCTPELKGLTDAWIEAYSKQQPLEVVNVQESVNASLVNVVFEDNESLTGSQWKMPVGYDAIVPVCNASNPLISQLHKEGITKDGFIKIISGSAQSEDAINMLAGHFYLLQDEGIKKCIADFTGLNNELVSGIPVANTDELIAAIQKDPAGFGFVSMHYILSNGSFLTGISVLPIDKNNNGRLDSFENIYSGADDLMRGVYLGKFPRELSRSIYAVAAAKPTDKSTAGFLSWIMNDGQKVLNENGYSVLASAQGKANVESLAEVNEEIATPGNAFSAQIIVSLAVAGIIALVVLIAVFSLYSKRKAVVKATWKSKPVVALKSSDLNVPMGLHYDKSHTWAFMEKDGIVRIGVDDFMQHLTGKITKVNLKSEGESVRKGENILTIIKDGKQLNLKAPISGIIRQTNDDLKRNPNAINYSPYSDGWIYSIVPLNWEREQEFLFNPEKYKQWISNEFARLREFLSSTLQSNDPEYSKVILQDGGEVIDEVLSDLQPELWEEFQSKFIETSK